MSGLKNILTAVVMLMAAGLATDSFGKVKLRMGEEYVVVRGIRPEDHFWGPYQFPRPYNLGDRIVVPVHMNNDDIESYGSTSRWFESRDDGQNWTEIDSDVDAECGLLMANGDRIYFPPESGENISHYKMIPIEYYTPGYDFSEKADAETLPIPDGITYWMWNTEIRTYNAHRLPEPLCRKEWHGKRIMVSSKEMIDETVPVEWPYLTRVVHTQGNKHVVKSIFPRGVLKTAPDGSVWVSGFSGEGHINPANGQYSPYYSAELFRSDDMGHSFRLVSHMEYPADGDYYPYLSGGFSDSDYAWMPDGSMVWFLRSNWFASTGEEWSPMYMSRSTDMGKTWSKPIKFSDRGTLPRLVSLPCGTTLLCYARPGTFVQASLDDSGLSWSDPLEVMSTGDRSGLANIPPKGKATFHQWVGSCNNPELLPIDDTSALLFYSDFYYPDDTGVKRKTILCRRIWVERE